MKIQTAHIININDIDTSEQDFFWEVNYDNGGQNYQKYDVEDRLESATSLLYSKLTKLEIECVIIDMRT